MKYLIKLFSFIAIFTFLHFSVVFSQNAGDYRTFQSGDWDNIATWEYYDGSFWVAATNPPSSLDGVIAIQNGHSVNVTSDVTVDDVVIESGGSLTVNSGATLQMASDIATITGDGSFTLSSGAGLGITSPDGITASSASGNIQTATRVFDTGANYIYNGSVSQNTGDGLPTTVNNLTINNTNGVTLSGSLTVDGVLTFSSGKLITGPNVITINAMGSVSGAGPGQYVYGYLQKNFMIGPQTFTFDVGGSINYRPVTVSFANVTTSGKLTVNASFGDHYAIGSSLIDPAKSVNCFWTLTNTGMTYTSYDVTFNYVASDVDAGADPDNFIIKRWNGANWFSTTTGTRTATSTQAVGLTLTSDFIIGEPLTHKIIASADPNGTINPSGDVYVLHGNDQTFTISPNAGYHLSDLFVDGVHVDSTTSYTFYNVTDDHTISATFEINTYTITATSTPGGTITPSGAVAVDYGSDKTFTITPNTGYHFVDLFVDGVHVDSTTSYTFYNVTDNHTINAIFDIDKYAIFAGTSEGGSITPSGVVIVDYGSDQTFTITPSPGYHFVDLFVDSVHVDSTVSYTFYNVTSNHSIYATFDINTYTITASASAGGTITPVGDISVNYGSDKTFTITPNTGYHLVDLFVDGVHVDSTTSYTFYNVTANHTIHAEFGINSYTITATASAGGTMTPTGDVSVNYGSDKTFTITPNTGYHFVDLFVDGVHVDSTTSYTFYNVTANHTIHAEFGINSYTITATASAGGTITPAGDVSVNYGSDKTFTITPNTGYHLVDLFVDGVHVDSTTSYTFYNVTANHTIHAEFGINSYTIITTASTGGTITPSGIITVNYGTDQQFTITPNPGYHLVNLFVDGIHVDSVTSYTFYNVTADHMIHAEFGINSYTITATASAGGTITPAGDVSVNYGSDKTFTITPNTGYHLVDLFVDGVHVDSTTSYTFYNVTANHTIHAEFAINMYIITADASEGGMISPSGPVSVSSGSSQQFLIIANTGYHLDTLFVDGIRVDSTTSYTFYNVTTNHTIYARFAINTYTITATAGPHGSINPSGNVVVNYGSDQLFNFIPDPGYVVDSVLVDGVYVGEDTSYTFTNVTANHTIHVLFKLWEGVKDVEEIPTEYALRQNYPNPFNPSTMIRFDLPKQSIVTLKVYNLIGTEVATVLDNQLLTAGYKEVKFDATNFASGIYFYRIHAVSDDGNTFTNVKRMILVK